MSNPFQDLFSGGNPQRRELKFRVATDAQGNIELQPLAGQVHIISPENSLDTVNLDPDAFLDCGCSAKANQTHHHCCEPGCPHVVCERHVRYCAVCTKGLCGQCQHALEVAPNQRIDLCPAHYREGLRRQRWRRVAKAVLSPFVTFNGRNSQS